MFTHLHLHTQYSLMEGAIRVKELPKALKAMNYSACAITDHGNMFGVVEFYHAMKKAELRPIIGMGANVTEGSCRQKETNAPRAHYQTLLLCQNREGYRNLTYLGSMGFTEGKYRGIPRVDHELLEQYHEGLIALSGGLEGELAQRLLNGKKEEAYQIAQWYKDVFAGRYYIELQNTGREDQALVNPQLIQLAKDLSLPLVGTNDCYYLKQQESEAHYIFQLLGLQKRVSDPDLPPQLPNQHYLKSPEEMQDALRGLPEEVMSNTQLIAEQCELSLDNKTYFLPKFEIPTGYDENSWFTKEAEEGLELRLKYLYKLYAPEESFEAFRKSYDERLKFELGVIIDMKFPGYFLIVADFINWAKDHGIPVGPGRGSGAGSLVAYSIRITDVDPLKYGLLFERFLNPDRVSLPDFDIDFEVKGREQVIKYVRNHYGAQNVCQIATFQSLQAKAVVRNVARVLDFPYSDADKIAKLIPNTLGISLSEALEQEPDLARLQTEGSDNEQKLIFHSLTLEGLNTHLGTHAAGVIIMDQDIRKVMPVCTSKDDALQSMYPMKYAEDQGAVKFDFLGLLNLSIIDVADKLVKKEFPEDQLDMSMIPMDDDLTFQLFRKGETTGIFQLESSGMKKLLVDMEPDRFEDIVAILALYRPGPLGSGMVEDFVECKHGRRQVNYPHPLLESILKETYGVMVYQEQIMQAVQVLAKFTLGQADLLRRAIGKKIAEILMEQRSKFVEGCEQNPEFVAKCPKNTTPAEKANEIFDLIDYFSGYGFNKSHTVAYGLVSYQTAYLKAHYPSQFMAALLNCSMTKPDKIVNFIGDCKEMEVQVLPPDVNYSLNDFTVAHLGYKVSNHTLQHLRVYNFPPKLLKQIQALLHKPFDNSDDFFKAVGDLTQYGENAAQYREILLRQARWDAVRFGLNAVKSVGAHAVDAIIEVRNKKANKRITDFMDFMKSVDFKRVNLRVLETLVKCGAFDSLHENRAQLFETLESAVHLGQEFQRAEEPNQNSLFDLLDAEDLAQTETPLEFPDIKDWTTKERLNYEKEGLGFYVSGHPLDHYLSESQKVQSTADLSDSENSYKDGDSITLVGIIVSKTIRLNKQSEKFAIVKLEDLRGTIEFPIYNKLYETVAPILGDEPLWIKGRINYRDDEIGIIPDEIQLLSQYRAEKGRSMVIEIEHQELSEAQLSFIRGSLLKYPGSYPVHFKVYTSEAVTVSLELAEKISFTPALMDELAEQLKGQRLMFKY
ncbi:DNA polymerase III subunit alpha [Deltaproteobacteria bacterium TL4]